MKMVERICFICVQKDIRKLSNYIAKPIYKWSFKHEENIIVSWCCLHLFL